MIAFYIGQKEGKIGFIYNPSDRHKIEWGGNFINYNLNPALQRPIGDNSSVNTIQLEKENANEMAAFVRVVDAKGFNDSTWFDRAGNFHSEELHVVERYTRTAPDVVSYEATMEDPQTFTRPWKISLPLYRRIEKNAQLMDFKCVEFVEELLYGAYRKKPLTK